MLDQKVSSVPETQLVSALIGLTTETLTDDKSPPGVLERILQADAKCWQRTGSSERARSTGKIRETSLLTVDPLSRAPIAHPATCQAPTMLAGVVLGAVLASAVSAGQIRGLPRSLEPLYAGVGGKFTCLDGSKSIALAQINDDFCDCKDGSDEPGTSACSAGKFYCPNKGYRGKYIAALLVNDGVCDCCDGSDEWNGRVTCTNTCDVDGAEWRRQQADAIRKAEEGARLRQLYADEGRKQASERKSKIDVLEAALEKAKAAKEAADKASDSYEAP